MRHYITTLLLLLTLGVASGVNAANAVIIAKNAVFTKTQAKRKAVGEYSDDVVKEIARRKVRLKAPKRVSCSFDEIATQATRNAGSNKVVLGKFSEGGRSYTKVGAHYKASYLKIKNWNEVTKGMTQAEIWEINEAFLRQQLSAGKQVILSHNPATATGFFAKEVTYLEELGYRFVQEGWVWKAVK